MPRNDEWVMGALAAQNQYRPLGNDPWTNTMRGTAPAPGQGFAVSADPVLYPTASPLVNITEGDIKRATEVGLAASGGGIKGQQIKAYHSSPHDFDKFDLSKIGTGEGAQVYGHGLYFAENPAVSGQGGQYWRQFMSRFGETPERHAAEKLAASKFDREAALNDSKWNLDQIKDYVKHGNPQTYDEVQRWHYYNDKLLPMRQAEHDLLASGKPVGPRTYEVNIKADPAHMLDWDKGLHRQSPEVRSALEKFGFKSDKDLMKASDDALYEALTGNPNTKIPQALPDPTGDQIYGRIARGQARGSGSSQYFDKAAATQAMQEAGIPGIKYLDQGSRLPRNITDLETQIAKATAQLEAWGKFKGDRVQPFMMQSLSDEIADLHGQLATAKATPQSYNYVIFDPNRIDIMKKYGIAGAAPTAMGALAAQDAYRGD